MGSVSSKAPMKMMKENPSNKILGGDALNHRIAFLIK
jgi:hypothetical protein